MQNINMILESLKKEQERIFYVVSVIAFFIYIFFSAKNAFLSGRLGWEDESHFWTMLRYCSIKEIFALMNVEGHMMLWYLIVMPFAKLNFPYPYTMQIINWIICTTALFVMWKKAPFHDLIKAGIIISPVFLDLYSVHARCYGIGAMFLFAACAIYNQRLNRPYIYFTMLALAANTSLQGAIGATALGISFLFDLFKKLKFDKSTLKQILTIIGITILIGIMYCAQFSSIEIADFETSNAISGASRNILKIFLGLQDYGGDDYLHIRIIELRIFILILTVILASRARAFFIYLISFGLCTIFFLNIYTPRIWHTSFYLVYLIVVCWIFLLEKPAKQFKTWLTYLLAGLLIGLVPLKIEPPMCNYFLKKAFETSPELLEGKLFTDITPINMAVMLPDLNSKGVFIYDMHNRNLSKFEAMITYFNKKAKEYKPSDLAKYIDKDRMNYVITLEKRNENYFAPLKIELRLAGAGGDKYFYIYKVK